MTQQQQTKITKKVIEQVIMESIPEVKQVIHQPATNLWFLKFGKSVVEADYSKLAELSLIPSMKDFELKKNHHTIVAKLNLREVNTYYERMIKH